MSEKTNYIFTNLFISLYNEKNQQRFEELHTCLMNNLKSGIFDAVWIIAEVDEDGKVDYISKFDVKPYTVNVLPCTTRPTFRTFFNAINNIDDMSKREFNSSIGKANEGINIGMPISIQPQQEESVYVCCNSDIYFEDLPVLPTTNQCFALTRWDIQKDGSAKFLGRSDSQDSWLVRGRIKMPRFVDYHTGVKGCDNRLARELATIGYEMLNPSLTVKSYHLHANPTDHNKSDKKVFPPYLRLTPIAL